MKLYQYAAVLALTLVPTCVAAQELDTRHYIYVEASGSMSMPAEYAIIGAIAKSKGATPDVAVDANNETMDALMAALQEAGLKRSDIETGSFGFETVYIKPATANSYEQPDPDRDKFDGYRVTNAFSIRVGDLDNVGDVLAIVSRAGVEIRSLGFASSKALAAQESTRELAVKNALARAELMAQAANVKLGQLLQMREGSGYNPETMEAYQADGAADLMLASLSGIVPADIVVSNSVSAKWEVLPLD